MSAGRSNNLRVGIFCGGRGSATIVRELARHPEIKLTLLVNAYDDGLSTGALREFIPGLLGPSDFRKNLSYLVDPYSESQYALQRLLEYRMPDSFADRAPDALRQLAQQHSAAGFPPEFVADFRLIEPGTSSRLTGLLSRFVDYAQKRDPIDYTGFSFGNLIFAGAYLERDASFNAAIYTLADLFSSQARILNVSDGEARTLVGLKADGSVLGREAEVVGEQSDQRITDFYFLARPLDDDQRSELDGLSMDDRRAWLAQRALSVALSPEAADAIATADVLIYGPGTQHSSLLPSYEIAHEALHACTALKVWVANLQEDADILGMDVLDLVDNALHYLHDENNEQGSIDHMLVNTPTDPNDLPLDRSRLDDDGRYKNMQVVERGFAARAKSTRHNGYQIVKTTLDLYRQHAGGGSDELEIHVDLYRRGLALSGLIQEFSEIDWESIASRVRLVINADTTIDGDLPNTIEIQTVNQSRPFSDVDVFDKWLSESAAEYLVTMTGDGEYRFRDIAAAVRSLRTSNFGAVYGSRTQSRRQFQSSILAAYGESGLTRRLSSVGGLLLTFLLAIRFRVILSDPLTGFRAYSRGALPPTIGASEAGKSHASAMALTRQLIEQGVEIAEIPVSYRTYAGFTNPRWRLRRGIKNLLGAFR